MSFVHEFNKNNKWDTKRDEFAWHSEILTNRLRLISLFININEIGEITLYQSCGTLSSFVNISNWKPIYVDNLKIYDKVLEFRSKINQKVLTYFFVNFDEKVYIVNVDWNLIVRYFNTTLTLQTRLDIAMYRGCRNQCRTTQW